MAINFLSGIDVDNGVLYTDTSNNRVGINTSSPQGYSIAGAYLAGETSESDADGTQMLVAVFAA